MYFQDTGLPWVAPSPNLPTPVSAMVYPGQVIWEGTNVSEGRGTTQPFEIFGAPYLYPEKVLSTAGGNQLPGVILRKHHFEPTSNKWQGTLCQGFQLHITNPHTYKPYFTTLKLVRAVIMNHMELFSWNDPPYEYEFEKRPIDLIIGDRDIRRRIETFDSIENIEASWQDELEGFKKTVRDVFLYPPKK
jgi:uncharacterized protein YbbC (DUF1343 family)